MKMARKKKTSKVSFVEKIRETVTKRRERKKKTAKTTKRRKRKIPVLSRCKERNDD